MIGMRYIIKLELNRKKTIIFDTKVPTKELALIDPKLHMEMDNAGSFECTFPVTNIAVINDTDESPMFVKFKTRVIVYWGQDDSDGTDLNEWNVIQRQKLKPIWRGRLLSVETDFYGQIHTYFEGDLSSLNDTYITLQKYHYDPNASPDVPGNPNANWYMAFSGNSYPIVNILNTHRDEIRQKNFNVERGDPEWDAMQDYYIWAIVLDSEPNEPITKDVPDNIFALQDLLIEKESAMSALQKIIDNYGGHYRLLYDTYYESAPATGDGGVLSGTYVDRARFQWVELPEEYPEGTTPSQSITFGKNLLDFTKKTEIKDLVTCIIPVGKTIHKAGSTALGVEYRVASMPTIGQGTWDAPVYTQLQTKPDDWETNFWSYFEKRRDVYCPIYKTYKVPEFDSRIHYSATLDPTHRIVYPHNKAITRNSLSCAQGTVIGQNSSTSTSTEMDKYSYHDSSFDISTGFWQSSDALSAYGQNYSNSFACSPGEKYYILATGRIDSGKPTCCLITDGAFRTWDYDDGNYTWYFTPVSNTQVSNNPNNNRNGMIYKLVTIPDFKWGNGMYLNLSSRTHYGQDEPKEYKYLHMNIWGTRIVNEYVDEKITLCGLADGEYAAYMGTTTDTTKDGNTYGYGRLWEGTVMQNPFDNTSEPIPVFVYPAEIREGEMDGFFLYPNDMQPNLENYAAYFEKTADIPSPEDLPSWGEEAGKTITPLLTRVCDEETGDVFLFERVGQSSYIYSKDSSTRLYYKKAGKIFDVQLVKKYGVIEKTVEFADIDDPNKLKDLGCETLFKGLFEKMSLTVTALDLAVLDNTITTPRILDPIRIVSPYHKVDMILPLKSMDIPFNKLEDQTFDIGYEKEQKITDRQKVQNIKKGG